MRWTSSAGRSRRILIESLARPWRAKRTHRLRQRAIAGGVRLTADYERAAFIGAGMSVMTASSPARRGCRSSVAVTHSRR